MLICAEAYITTPRWHAGVQTGGKRFPTEPWRTSWLHSIWQVSMFECRRSVCPSAVTRQPIRSQVPTEVAVSMQWQVLVLTDWTQPFVLRHTLIHNTQRLCHNYTVPRTRTKFVNTAFSVTDPIVWNSLPSTVCEADSLYSFKLKLKTHLFTLF